MMSDAENILNNDEFFAYRIDTPKKDIDQHKKRECLKPAISKGKVYLLGGKNNGLLVWLIKLATEISMKHVMKKDSVL